MRLHRSRNKPCSDCPWARTALQGWLGPHSPEEWLAIARAECKVECHVHPNVQCAGLATFRGNICKSPRDPSILVLPANRELVFNWDNEFLEHHKEAWDSASDLAKRGVR